MKFAERFGFRFVRPRVIEFDSREIDMAEIDLNKLFDGATAERIARQSDSSTSYLQVLDRMFLKTYTETDPVQSAAIRQISMREAPIGPVAPA